MTFVYAALKKQPVIGAGIVEVEMILMEKALT
jgi:hypothetical protein